MINIVEKPIKELIPYQNNPRKNDKAADKVAASIKEFGFKVPLVIDRNGVVVTGHTRLKAAKQLGIKTVPCIIADDLDENQIKAFRLADNKVAEAAKWDYDLLKIELEGLDIDVEDFGFDVGDIYDDGYYGDERERTNNAYNLHEYDNEASEGFFDIPV